MMTFFVWALANLALKNFNADVVKRLLTVFESGLDDRV